MLSSIALQAISGKHNFAGGSVAMIVKKDGAYHVKSKDGTKNLGGPFKTRLEAIKRLAQVQYYKAKKNV